MHVRCACGSYPPVTPPTSYLHLTATFTATSPTPHLRPPPRPRQLGRALAALPGASTPLAAHLAAWLTEAALGWLAAPLPVEPPPPRPLVDEDVEDRDGKTGAAASQAAVLGAVQEVPAALLAAAAPRAYAGARLLAALAWSYPQLSRRLLRRLLARLGCSGGGSGGDGAGAGVSTDGDGDDGEDRAEEERAGRARVQPGGGGGGVAGGGGGGSGLMWAVLRSVLAEAARVLGAVRELQRLQRQADAADREVAAAAAAAAAANAAVMRAVVAAQAPGPAAAAQAAAQAAPRSAGQREALLAATAAAQAAAARAQAATATVSALAARSHAVLCNNFGACPTLAPTPPRSPHAAAVAAAAELEPQLLLADEMAQVVGEFVGYAASGPCPAAAAALVAAAAPLLPHCADLCDAWLQLAAPVPA